MGKKKTPEQQIAEMEQVEIEDGGDLTLSAPPTASGSIVTPSAYEFPARMPEVQSELGRLHAQVSKLRVAQVDLNREVVQLRQQAQAAQSDNADRIRAYREREAEARSALEQAHAELETVNAEVAATSKRLANAQARVSDLQADR